MADVEGGVADPGRTLGTSSVLNQYSMNVLVIYLVTVVSSHRVILSYFTVLLLQSSSTPTVCWTPDDIQ